MSQPGFPSPPPAYGAMPAPVGPRVRGTLPLLLVLIAGGGVSLAFGVYGRLHHPTGLAVDLAGFSGPLEAKVWLATAVITLAAVQLVSALWMYGRLPVRAPGWIGGLHRWSGRVAFLLAVPVALHCLYALGFQSYDTRVLLHSIAGCLFFGVFTVKMLTLSRSDLPGWLLPVAGGLVFTLLTAVWLSSALWFFTTTGVRF